MNSKCRLNAEEKTPVVPRSSKQKASRFAFGKYRSSKRIETFFVDLESRSSQ